jgi:O-antigen/teichoic acid export membrane protein
MPDLRQFMKRTYNSAVAWSWVMNGLRLASGVLLLPLLLQYLSEADFGMYFVFLH